MRAKPRVLVISEPGPPPNPVTSQLNAAGYDAVEAADAAEALLTASRIRPDLVVFDRSSPDLDGIGILRSWREEAPFASVPVLMTSGHGAEADKVSGLRAGADDYLVKPFGREEFLARVDALLRRTRDRAPPINGLKHFHGISLDLHGLRVTVGGDPIHVGPIEFKLLNLLMSNPERVLSRNQIVEQVWRPDAHVDARTVDVHIRRLRTALRPAGRHRYVQTVRGVGYRLSASLPS